MGEELIRSKGVPGPAPAAEWGEDGDEAPVVEGEFALEASAEESAPVRPRPAAAARYPSPPARSARHPSGPASLPSPPFAGAAQQSDEVLAHKDAFEPHSFTAAAAAAAWEVKLVPPKLNYSDASREDDEVRWLGLPKLTVLGSTARGHDEKAE